MDSEAMRYTNQEVTETPNLRSDSGSGTRTYIIARERKSLHVCFQKKRITRSRPEPGEQHIVCAWLGTLGVPYL